MDSAPGSTVSRALLSANLCPRHTCTLGISFFLLVPVCLGHSRLGFTGIRLFQAQNLKQQGWQAGRSKCSLPPLGEGSDASVAFRIRRLRLGLCSGFCCEALVGKELLTVGLYWGCGRWLITHIAHQLDLDTTVLGAASGCRIARHFVVFANTDEVELAWRNVVLHRERSVILRRPAHAQHRVRRAIRDARV